MKRKVKVPVYRAGTRVVSIEMQAVTDEQGEAFVTLAEAVRWEALHHQMAATIEASSRLTRRNRRLFGQASTRMTQAAGKTSASTLETARLTPVFA